MDIYKYADERAAFITIVLLLVVASLYILGVTQGRRARSFVLAGLGVHFLSIVKRGLELGWLPLAEKHDNISFMAFCLALSYVLVTSRKKIKDLELAVLPLASLLVFAAIKHRRYDDVSPFMDSVWFYLHTFSYFLSYALLALSAAVGVLYIIGGARDLERLQYRAALLGWTLLSVSLVVGGIWFYQAYGVYFLWTSKEMWITLTWLALGLYVHTRLMPWMQGRPAAVLGVLGFAAALFTYFGVGTIILSPPTQF